MMVPCWIFPLAIALGNTFVLKPSERTPLTANKLAQLLLEAGLPDGVLNVVHGAHAVVDALTGSNGVKAISFVGSQPVAKYVYERSAASGKRVQALQEAAEAMVIGSGMRDDVTLTPVIREEQRVRIESYIARGSEEGAVLLLDGRLAAERGAEGYFLGPTIFDQVLPGMTIAREEIFGPVLSVLRAADLDEALSIVNSSRFGNSAVIYTENAKAVRLFREEAEAGMLGVNVGVPAPMVFFPFSGWKDSFYGDLHANGKDGLAFYTKKKMITSRYF